MKIAVFLKNVLLKGQGHIVIKFLTIFESNMNLWLNAQEVTHIKKTPSKNLGLKGLR